MSEGHDFEIRTDQAIDDKIREAAQTMLSSGMAGPPRRGRFGKLAHRLDSLIGRRHQFDSESRAASFVPLRRRRQLGLGLRKDADPAGHFFPSCERTRARTSVQSPAGAPLRSAAAIRRSISAVQAASQSASGGPSTLAISSDASSRRSSSGNASASSRTFLEARVMSAILARRGPRASARWRSERPHHQNQAPALTLRLHSTADGIPLVAKEVLAKDADGYVDAAAGAALALIVEHLGAARPPLTSSPDRGTSFSVIKGRAHGARRRVNKHEY